MKAIILFVEDDKFVEYTDGMGNRPLNEFTDFKTESGFYDLLDLSKHFKCTILDYKQPFSIQRKLEGLSMLLTEEINLNTLCVKNRLFGGMNNGK